MRRRSLLLLLGSAGCGWILYPERKGRTGGRIDTPILIIDLLWLLVGIIPGVICLIVDFTTGCIYESGGRHVAVPQEGPSRLATVAVELDGAIVATGQVQPDGRAELTWSATPDLSALRARGRVVARSHDNARAEARLADLV
jgi:hypothetical protein